MRRNLLFLLFLLALASCTAGSGKIYTINKVSDTMVLLRLQTVEVGPDATHVTLRYQAGEELRRVGVHPPGAEGAFVITDQAESVTYKLVKVDGISTLPARTVVEPGGTLEFNLVFEAIPGTLKKIHIGEGRYRAASGETSWHFLDVALND